MDPEFAPPRTFIPAPSLLWAADDNFVINFAKTFIDGLKYSLSIKYLFYVFSSSKEILCSSHPVVKDQRLKTGHTSSINILLTGKRSFLEI